MLLARSCGGRRGGIGFANGLLDLAPLLDVPLPAAWWLSTDVLLSAQPARLGWAMAQHLAAGTDRRASRHQRGRGAARWRASSSSAAGDPAVSAGTLFAVLSYLWLVVHGIDQVPRQVEQRAKLTDVARRLSAWAGAPVAMPPPARA